MGHRGRGKAVGWPSTNNDRHPWDRPCWTGNSVASLSGQPGARNHLGSASERAEMLTLTQGSPGFPLPFEVQGDDTVWMTSRSPGPSDRNLWTLAASLGLMSQETGSDLCAGHLRAWLRSAF